MTVLSSLGRILFGDDGRDQRNGRSQAPIASTSDLATASVPHFALRLQEQRALGGQPRGLEHGARLAQGLGRLLHVAGCK